MRVILFVLLGGLFSASAANVYVVTHTGDDGAGSLRWALQAADSHLGPDTVSFQLKKSDPGYRAQGDFWQIALQSPLPSLIDDGLTLVGATAADGRPAVLLYGGNLPIGSTGWTISSSRNRIVALGFAGFRGTILWLKGEKASDNTIENCFFGVLPDGRTAINDPQAPTQAPQESRGLYLSQGCRNNILRRNLISNMFFEAVLIETSHRNVLENNLIGLLQDGVTPLGNGWINVPRYEIENQKIKRFAGVRVSNGSRGNRIGPGNVICASGRAGIHIEGSGTDSTRVIGNLLGLGADGESHANCGNGEAGLKVQRGARYTIIGGGAGEGNVISANYSSGIQIRENVTATVIAGNLIGVNASGTRLAANSHNGIYFFGQKECGYPQRNRVGPHNVIISNGLEKENEPYAGTWAAVRLDSIGTAFNEIFENYLGRNTDGTVDGSANSGVIIGSGAHDNIIGPDNFFGRHRKYGIWIRQSGSVRNRITRNRFSGEVAKAVMLEGGGNQMLPPPTLSQATNGVKGTAVPRALIECYDALSGIFLAAAQADADGRFFCPLERIGSVVALQTDEDGNSSSFSSSLVVPVELVSFTAEVCADGVLLCWQTCSESNNLGFYIERGPQPFVTIGFVAGAGTSHESRCYQFIDTKPPKGRVVYRLRQIDTDGTFTFTSEVVIERPLPSRPALSAAYPNPFNGRTAFTISLPESAPVLLTVVDALGRTVETLVCGDLEAGCHPLLWTADDAVPSGVYFLRFVAPQCTVTQKILLLR